MCGITGFLTRSNSPNSPETILQKMSDRLAHRGPNDKGVWWESDGQGGCMGLGHRRLAILDLSQNGHQPMKWEEYVLSYNGEIYNYLELRRELIEIGYSFHTQSDSEVVLVAYKEWGIEAFRKFNGMWAMALYDRNRKELLLSRDRFGKKPLYYHLTESGIVFGSEIKSLFEFPGTPRKANLQKVYRYLSGNYRYVDTDTHSFFSDIEQIPKATVCTISSELTLSVRKYWALSPSLEEPTDMTDESVVKTFQELFFNATQLRLRSDVPVACFLSGGLDSTSITCVASKVFGNKIQTFSGVTGEGVYDESEYIDAVVAKTGTDHHYIRPDPTDLFETVKEMLQFHDEPICTVTWYSIYLIAKKIAQFDIRVVLNGHGGDETCGGYWDYYQYHFWDLQQQNSTGLNTEISQWKTNHDRPLAEIEQYRNYIANLETHRQRETDRFPNYDFIFTEEFRRMHANQTLIENPYKSWLSRRMYSDLLFETVPPVLRAEDRNTMAFSIESRSPFLDYRIAEFLFKLPNRFKIRAGLGKWLVRESMKGILPELVRTRMDKTGFIAPFDEWIRTSQRKAFDELLECPAVQNRGIYDLAQLKKLYLEHQSSQKNHAMFFWQFLNLELWFQKFLD